MSTEYEVVKAGGWSLANGERTRRVIDYIQANPAIHYFVPSAPGMVGEGDIKITDHLIECCRLRRDDKSYAAPFTEIHNRFATIAKYWGFNGLEGLLGLVEQGLSKGANDDWVISRGEWMNGRMLSDILGWRFVDPTTLIRFGKNGQPMKNTYSLIASRLKGERSVIPGFYGLGADGLVRIFPRDGSDITGAIISCGVNARVYRNLTSADGVLSADPRIVHTPKLITKLTFEEYRELGNGGTKVLHRDTILPVVHAKIPINVRHSEKPSSSGSMVVARRSNEDRDDVIGIAGKGGFVSLNIHKYGMNDEIGIESKVLEVLRRAGISIEHVPSGADYMSVIFSKKQLKDCKDKIIESIQKRIKPDKIEYEGDFALLSVVGQGLRYRNSQVSGKLFSALDKSSIPCRGYTLGVSGISITVIVDSSSLDDAIRVAYDTFIREM